jgi:hypothetical protein
MALQVVAVVTMEVVVVLALELVVDFLVVVVVHLIQQTLRFHYYQVLTVQMDSLLQQHHILAIRRVLQ